MTFLPRELGSSPHNPFAVDCVERALNAPFWDGEVCPVCLGAAREISQLVDQTLRELGS
jgi:hypothetical protein